MKKTALFIAAAAAAALSHAEVNPTLAEMSGSVMVNSGSSYEPARPGMQLESGYRLMAMAGGSATVNYGGECSLTLKENQIIRVGDAASCQNYQVGGSGGAAAGGGGAAAAAGGGGTILGVSATTAAIVGGAVVAGAVIVENNNDDNNNNISN